MTQIQVFQTVATWLRGSKTNIIGAAMILYAITQAWGGAMSINDAVRMIGEGSGLVTLRAAIAKLSPSLISTVLNLVNQNLAQVLQEAEKRQANQNSQETKL